MGAGLRPFVFNFKSALGIGALVLFAASAGARPKPASSPHPGPRGPALPTPAPLAGQVVGKFELAAPALSSFVLRGTLPVPAGTFPRVDGQQPFGIIDSTGQTVPAQCEIVSRYPRNSHGADVVEILARVQRPSGVQPGARITYSIVEFVHPNSVMNSTSLTAHLLNTPGAVTLRTKDVFNNAYRADLLRGRDGNEIIRLGEAAIQARFYETMLPVSGSSGPPTGPLTHFFQVHSYTTEWVGEDMLSLDLRVHNGPSGENSQTSLDDPQAKLYFQDLELWVPTGWTVVSDWSDPTLGQIRQEPGFTVLPLVTPNADGTMHMMPVQAQMQRRLALVRTGQEARARSLLNEEWLGFCRRGTNAQAQELYSWWNASTANYFPQRHRLPELDHLGQGPIRARLTIDLHRISDRLVDGAAGGGALSYPAQGWAHPWGVKYGGMTGGTEIFLYDGMATADSASADGYRLSQLALRLYAERNPTALYNADGNPTQYSDWITHGSQFDYIHMQFYLTLLSGGPDPFGFGNAPQFQVDHVNAQGLAPVYETELLGFKPIDLQHQTRITRSMKVLSWLGNDAMAKDDLRMQAELVRLSYHDLACTPAGGLMGTGMLADIQSVTDDPGIGVNFGRYEGWGMDSMAAAYSVGSIAWRASARPWFDSIVEMLKVGQADCSGIIQRLKSPKIVDGLYYGRQSIEQAIIENGLWSIGASVYRGDNPAALQIVHNVIRESVYSMVRFPAWSAALRGPLEQLAVAPLDPALPPFCGTIPPNGTSPGVDKFQIWSSFAYGYELTGDPVFLRRAMMSAGGTHLLVTLENSGYSNLENRSALLALVQSIF